MTILIAIASSTSADVVMSTWVVTDMDLVAQLRERLGEAVAECLLSDGALAAIVKAGDEHGAITVYPGDQ